MLGEADVGADSGSKSCVRTVESLIVRVDIVCVEKRMEAGGADVLCAVR